MPETKSDLQSRLQDLQHTVDKLDEQYSAASIVAQLDSLRGHIQEMHSRGYAYLHDLEALMPVLRNQLETARNQLESGVHKYQGRLRQEVVQAGYAVNHAVDDDETSLNRANKEIDDVERRLRETETELNGLVEPITTGITQSTARLADIKRYLEARDEASFAFESGENVVLADKAEWVVTGKGGEDPDGIVFLSSKRLIFEQKEKVGKKLGMFGGKQQHEVKWQITLDQIDSVETENKGLLGRKDMLTLMLKPGAEHAQLVIEVKSADNKFWREMLDKAIGGQLEA